MAQDFTGVYSLVKQENLDNYLKALDIILPLRKIVCLLSPEKDICHDGDHMVIKTLTTFKNYVMDFNIGVQFEENLEAIDGRRCQTTVCWDGDRLICTQVGEKKDRGWTHWLEGDILHLEMRAEGVVAKQEFRRKK
ncbi:retinol-binding protein 1-like isoform X2 [Carcharodon carcharias]|uniref:retinol-binding protein 1-like isoform X2 n=1 Tax=Carcharodon carcharias TaxID=13397 RepID=UPI001B7DB181|nr:retinol-binding protein 1-like isoform X2 [Carcharodon carcharias]